MDRGYNGKSISNHLSIEISCHQHQVEDDLGMLAAQQLNLLGRSPKMTLCWMPRLIGVEGNEKADELARKGALKMLSARSTEKSIYNHKKDSNGGRLQKI